MIRSAELYEALFDDEAFAALPDRVAQAFGARSAIFGWQFDKVDAQFLAHSLHFKPDDVAVYLREFALIDEWTVAHSRNPVANVALDLNALLPPGAWQKGIVYNEWLRPMGDDTAHCIGVYVENSRGRGSLVMHRGRTQKPFEQETIDQPTAHARHLRRMLSIRARLEAADRTHSVLHGFAEAAGPTLLVDCDLKLLNASPAGEALLRDARLLRVARGRVEAGVPATPALARGVSLACDRSEPSAELVLLHALGAGPVPLTIAPVTLRGKPLAMLLLDQPVVTPDIAPFLAERFGLTASEADIAWRIAQGESSRVIPDARGASFNTVKVQIKSVLFKMNCRRQVDVATLVQSMSRLAAKALEIQGVLGARG
ncbi:LuxR C-terminal-related transcriptional regulator [Sphingomonas sp.]|jgi:DNA-binding CsgD family transcriptional regulator|uniref:helix-turn-helix transcriptional regulator n=1 Tax=Sphingomonas sp. TaxID=28214 RepID=UPI002DE5AF36|nr:LuxR C-terminal-related transcriptional regulator [Sphingomonas sp.]HEV2567452.1 LuxR C-terminal-related transcriptional regulator [Sphingomonas sp.]